MTALLIVAIVLVSCVVWGIGTGYTIPQFYNKVAEHHFQYSGDKNIASFWAGLLWPITLPALMFVRDPSKGPRTSRTERKYAREIRDAEHRAALAKILHDEAMGLERAVSNNPLNIKDRYQLTQNEDGTVTLIRKSS